MSRRALWWLRRNGAALAAWLTASSIAGTLLASGMHDVERYAAAHPGESGAGLLWQIVWHLARGMALACWVFYLTEQQRERCRKPPCDPTPDGLLPGLIIRVDRP